LVLGQAATDFVDYKSEPRKTNFIPVHFKKSPRRTFAGSKSAFRFGAGLGKSVMRLRMHRLGCGDRAKELELLHMNL